jgi:ankyrin repeat protein
MTPLECAMEANNSEAVKLLGERGANLNAMNAVCCGHAPVLFTVGFTHFHIL